MHVGFSGFFKAETKILAIFLGRFGLVTKGKRGGREGGGGV